MMAEIVFYLGWVLIAPAWALMIFFPRSPFTQKFLGWLVIPIILSAIYVLLVLRNIPFEGGFGSVDDVVRLFQNREIMMAGWVHFMAFDIFVAAWCLYDSQKHGISHYAVAPSLALIGLAGPSGFFTYIATKKILGKKISIRFDQ